MTILDLFADDEPAPAAAPASEPVLTDQDVDNYDAGRLELRKNFVFLGWHKGGFPHLKTVFDSQTGQHDRGEARTNQKTVYIVPVPLPAAWLKDISLHSKAIALEEKLLERLGLDVKHYQQNGKQPDYWEQTGPAAEQWKLENCLCDACGWVKEECKCEIIINQDAAS